MTSLNVNPVSMAINLVFGWFVLSFLHAALRTIISPGPTPLVASFLDIALFRNSPARVINLIAIAVFGSIRTALWFLAKR